MFFEFLPAVLNSAMAEHKAFEDRCSNLPKAEADKLRAERRAEFKANDEHWKKLEIAEAGRARNFWGN